METAGPDPSTASDPVQGVLEYCRGGHLSDPSVMAESFHEQARLCFADSSGQLVRWSREEFFDKVRARPVTANNHLALKHDRIISVDKVGPEVAMVKLTIGYPPVLYTDVLSMLRIKGKWWIIAKSSDKEPFPSSSQE